MGNQTVILLGEDDPGHARLVEMNLRDAGLHNEIVRFEDGQEILDYLYARMHATEGLYGGHYLLLLDIRMPGVDGIEVLRYLKQDEELKKIPVLMLTTTDDPREVERCHRLGCSGYITKPVEYSEFCQMIKRLGSFLSILTVPRLNRVR